ncbi:MAG: 8-amino-7-oxononanoate synthase [Bacteroidetes bacterium MED-G17]|nr:MAG: 8-amino-7-oxononanoate synthase [Bacteroidetes bacterium TMED39]PDH52067.1 MAG: 8-amino-7-oxononanoate synthase [Bacteroidetes bacterium MED-G17]CAI8260841.1 MAG: 8-amino-7-oxononanoate synthase [Bacteroidetes bacterium MED-G17]
MQEISQRLQNKLTKRSVENSLRSLTQTNETVVDFFSNDYLGLAKEKVIHEDAYEKICNLENINGSTGSRLLSGNQRIHEKFETYLSVFHQSPSATLFNSGYDANVGFFSSVPQRGDHIFFDELVHASIRDGIKMSLASSSKFKHNDINDLKQKAAQIRHKSEEVYVVTETVFSMDGDSPNLEKLARVCAENRLRLVLDEAHSTGVFGDLGQGFSRSMAIEGSLFARVVTFGKSLGCHGAVILGSKSLKNYLINFARSLIYTTALSPHSVAVAYSAYQFLEANPNLQNQLKKRIDYFNFCKSTYLIEEYFFSSNSAIQSCLIADNTKAKNVSNELYIKGYHVKAILSPTVPKGKERLRFCLHSYNSIEQIQNVLKELKEILTKIG